MTNAEIVDALARIEKTMEEIKTRVTELERKSHTETPGKKSSTKWKRPLVAHSLYLYD